MRQLLAALLVVSALLACGSTPKEPRAASHADPATRRSLPAGDLIGGAGLYGGHAWLGIPFAQPPRGPLRWRAPEPLPRWPGERPALAFGSPCPQLASPLGGVPGPRGAVVGDEDCLFLNVYAPAFAPGAHPGPGARLPVMLWIHGGGNTIGAASFYDGSALATQQNLIVVTIHYRLGALGWFRHAALRESAAPSPTDPPGDASGNYGTLDQIRALEWVRDNIAAFGGDPGNVTIFGESAGGRNVLALLVSPRAAGLFHRAISQSGGTRSASLAEAEQWSDAPEPGAATSSNEILARVLVAGRIAPSRDAARAWIAERPAAALAGFLRDLPVDSLLRAYPGSGTGMVDLPQIFPDGAVLPSEPTLELLRTPGRFHAVPVMLGTNKDEEKLFAFLNPGYVWRLFGLLPIVRDRSVFFRDTDYRTRSWKIAGVDEPARALAASQPGRVFAYRWDWDEEPSVLWADLGELVGAAHGLEIPFVFDHWELGPEGRYLYGEANAPGREALSAAMQSYWAAFARDGDPGRGADGELPAWRPWDSAGEKYAVLDTPAGGGFRMSGETETMAELTAAIAADPTWADDAERCTALAWIHERAPSSFDAAAFASTGGGRCARFDPRELIAAAAR